MSRIGPNSVIALDLQIDRVAGQFEQALRRGESARIEDLAAQHAELGSTLVRELLWTEVEFLKSRRQPVDWDAYAARFPDQLTELEAMRVSDFPKAGDTSQSVVADSVVDSHPTTKPLDDPPLAPLDLSDYVLERKLGQGGQGEVHLAHQRSLGRRVAVKLLHLAATGDPQSEHRFLREARTLAQTRHPQIVTIHGIGRAPGGELFLVMEYIEGDDLARQIARRTFDVRDAVQIVLQIAPAIEHAHARGVIHRDLKPSNVLWDEVRGPVVTDFGLAKDLRAVDALTVTEQLMGTPTYMAPEQAHRRFGEISERSDVYGLAATLYALLTGQPPIAAGPLIEVLQRLTSDEPIAPLCELRPEVPASLSSICRKALAKYPRDRFDSVRIFSQNLKRWLAGGTDAKLPETVIHKSLPEAGARLEPGGRLGSYKLIAAIAGDPTRKIFRAEDPTGRPILLKCLPPEWLPDRLKRSQFRQEVLLSCSLSHPCLAKVVEAGTIDDTEFLALEQNEGESVAMILEREGPLPEARAVELLAPIAEALQQIHAAGVIYRDLRPQNIIVVADGRPMLADIRFSEELEPDDNVTMAGRGFVTSKYVAPELLLGRSSDVASDIYTLGATLYALVTGREPFAQDEERRDSINLLIAKNAGRFVSPRELAPDLSEAICELIADALRPVPSTRPSSAADFARRLTACLPQNRPATDPVPKEESDLDENLLHAVWDQLDPELQDAFSLAYNKKRRTGSTRISTRDLFEAMARLGTGPLRQVMDALPAGALPEPADAAVPVDQTLLREQPLLSDCVQESLTEFRRLDPDAGKVSPVDLFVDVARHGHGSSVVRLREHGVDPDAMERIVEKLGLQVIRRETLPRKSSSPEKYLRDDNVQFSVYRPKAIPPETWQPLLAFAHLSELPPDAPAGTPDPIAEVQRQAEQLLGALPTAYQPLTSDSSQPVPRSGELTFVPTGEGLEFNPPQRSFLWQEPVHREEFRFRAARHLEGKQARGRLSVYLGRLLIAEVSIVTRVDRQAIEPRDSALSGENRAYRFRRIYACVCRTDQAMIAEFQHYARLLHDTVLTSRLEADVGANEVRQQQGLISSADVFQLYWSNQALNSAELEAEWRYALSLRRPDFIRPLYWEEPFPIDAARSLPPPELLALGFQKIPARSSASSAAGGPRASIHQKLDRVRRPRVHIAYERPAPWLEILSGPQQGKILRLEKDRITIGRHPDADLPLESSSAGRYHTQAIRGADGWWIEDLESRNGTHLNGRLVTGRERLRDGDRLNIGNVVIGYREAGHDAATDAPARSAGPLSEPTVIPSTHYEKKSAGRAASAPPRSAGAVRRSSAWRMAVAAGIFLVAVLLWFAFGR